MDVRVIEYSSVITDSFTVTGSVILDEVPGDETTGTVDFVKDSFSSKHVKLINELHMKKKPPEGV